MNIQVPIETIHFIRGQADYIAGNVANPAVRWKAIKIRDAVDKLFAVPVVETQHEQAEPGRSEA